MHRQHVESLEYAPAAERQAANALRPAIRLRERRRSTGMAVAGQLCARNSSGPPSVNDCAARRRTASADLVYRSRVLNRVASEIRHKKFESC